MNRASDFAGGALVGIVMTCLAMITMRAIERHWRPAPPTKTAIRATPVAVPCAGHTAEDRDCWELK